MGRTDIKLQLERKESETVNERVIEALIKDMKKRKSYRLSDRMMKSVVIRAIGTRRLVRGVIPTHIKYLLDKNIIKKQRAVRGDTIYTLTEEYVEQWQAEKAARKATEEE